MVDSPGPARLAVLIDAENAPLWAIEPLLTEIARYGNVQVKRAYGDWSAGAPRSWKKTLLELSIRPVQVFAAVKGKNAADLTLAIDAMDLLHSGSVDGICLVSSDSDFTRLAERIREAGLTVYGFGEEKKTDPGLPAACDTFTFVEILAAAVPPAPALTPDQALGPTQAAPPTQRSPGTPSNSERFAAAPAANTPQTAVADPPKNKKKVKSTPGVPPTRATSAELRANAVLVSRLREAVTTNPSPDGWTHLSAVGSAIRKHPAIVLKTYGYSRLMDLMVATDLFELQQNGHGRSGPVHARVK
ncbi:conserved hypothetical protein [Parafrankia sp. Ea1.12]|uniref:NYN domain-containing protein n=1 Tax=Parafrankia sp. Ea1.12 TaxID=573499 RepID=UPI000DA5C315|nr:NYN domain-containing protein [Parafrankia sp. Ea1.12]SQD97612.1 conserved hypothetical protein [Parafrankia sp. Ea1.12]